MHYNMCLDYLDVFLGRLKNKNNLKLFCNIYILYHKHTLNQKKFDGQSYIVHVDGYQWLALIRLRYPLWRLLYKWAKFTAIILESIFIIVIILPSLKFDFQCHDIVSGHTQTLKKYFLKVSAMKRIYYKNYLMMK